MAWHGVGCAAAARKHDDGEQRKAGAWSHGHAVRFVVAEHSPQRALGRPAFGYGQPRSMQLLPRPARTPLSFCDWTLCACQYAPCSCTYNACRWTHARTTVRVSSTAQVPGALLIWRLGTRGARRDGHVFHGGWLLKLFSEFRLSARRFALPGRIDRPGFAFRFFSTNELPGCLGP